MKKIPLGVKISSAFFWIISLLTLTLSLVLLFFSRGILMTISLKEHFGDIVISLVTLVLGFVTAFYLLKGKEWTRYLAIIMYLYWAVGFLFIVLFYGFALFFIVRIPEFNVSPLLLVAFGLVLIGILIFSGYMAYYLIANKEVKKFFK
jgi:hypothetical protein